jgi:hypothetical protein
MRLRPALLLAVTLASLGSLLAPSACSSQGEGQYCSSANGNNDCQDGLICKDAPGLPDQLNSSRCCPPDPAIATVSACQQPTGDFDAAHEPPNDSSVFPEAEPTTEAAPTSEAGPNEASVDSSSPVAEAGAEASVESGTDGAPE